MEIAVWMRDFRSCFRVCSYLCFGIVVVITIRPFLIGSLHKYKVNSIARLESFQKVIKDKEAAKSQIQSTQPKTSEINKEITTGAKFSEMHCTVRNLSTPVTDTFKCVYTSFMDKSNPKLTKICVYDKNKDIFVSGDILKSGAWEFSMVKKVLNLLKSDPAMGLVDIGANIGMYTLPAATMGIQVVAVEPNIQSILRIQRAAQLSGTTQYITLVTNGISNKRTTSNIILSKHNQGDTRVAKGNCRGKSCGHSISTILLDDLLEVTKFKKAIVKMDIQAYEHRAFAHAEKFLTSIEIPYIYMEWEEMKRYYVSERHTSEDKKLVISMIDLLVRFGYVPFGEDKNSNRLDVNLWQNWSYNVWWIKRGWQP